MKLNKLFLLAGIVAASVFTSCSKDDTYEQGAVASGTQLQAVTFGSKNTTSSEVDPSDAKVMNITLYRDSAYLSEAASVPVKVVTNTDDVFVVPATAEFAAGAAQTQITVTYDKAKIGVPYNLEVAIDDSYVHPYKTSTFKTYATSIQVVKWNSLGIATWVDDFWYGGAFDVELYQRDDAKSIYRFESPYTDDFTGGQGTYQRWLTFNVSQTGMISWGNYFLINTMYDAGHEIYAFKQSYVTGEEADDTRSFAKYDKDGKMWYWYVNPYHYMLGLGGWSDYGYYLIMPEMPIPDFLLDDDEEEEE